MGDVGIVGVVIAVGTAIASFALGRWLSRKRRAAKTEQARTAARAGESRQVRRARERAGK